MGGVQDKAREAWLVVRPNSCDPYKVQEAKVLEKFDRVRVPVPSRPPPSE